MQDLRFRKKRTRRKIKSRNRKRKGERKLYFPKEKLELAASHPKEIASWAGEIAAVCLLALALVLFFGQRISIAGDSMSPALKNGDILLVNRLVYNAKKPARGDIIAFRPNGNENSHYMVKRVVGLPGETVQIRDGQVYINDKILKEDIYSFDISSAGTAAEPIELKEDEYFVLGDNHESSDDSRMADVGNVRREDIYGKIWFVASFGSDFGFVKD